MVSSEPTYLKRPALQRGAVADRQVGERVSEILLEIENHGMDAVRRYSQSFDGWNPPSFQVADKEIRDAAAGLSDELLEAISFAQEQISGFAHAQLAMFTPLEHETMPGVVLGHKHIPVTTVGAYVPGGRVPLLASSFMTVLVPKVAGVERVVACAPPREGAGIYPAMLHAMATSGADAIFAIGGVQALAAMAYGLEGMGPVDMLCGAGNAFVAEAKRQLFGIVGIDLLAGPTEILVIADETADAEIVAADLLGQAEHGPTSPTLLVTTSEALGLAVLDEIETQLQTLRSADVARVAWNDYGSVVVAQDRENAAQLSDAWAPEHLEVQTADDDWYLERLRNYGSLFVGQGATVAYSDKAIGTNHVLPTQRAARYTGGLWVGRFLKTVTYQRVLTDEATRVIGPPTTTICDAELMWGHGDTVRRRLARLD